MNAFNMKNNDEVYKNNLEQNGKNVAREVL